MIPRILIMPASAGPGTPDALLAMEALRLLSSADAATTMVSLADYPLPLAGALDEETPRNALLLAQRLAAHDALLIVTSERHALPPPVLLNALEWVGRVREAGGRPLSPFAGLIAGLAGASHDEDGGALACAVLRASLRSRDVEVVSAECRLRFSRQAFDTQGSLVQPQDQAALALLLERVVDHARALGRHG